VAVAVRGLSIRYRKIKMRIVPLTKSNQTEVMDIFNYYIENSFAAYPENKLPYEFFETFLRICEGYPSLIAEDDKGNVLGFGMLRAFNPFSAFSQTIVFLTY
jgi:L-amino acid N-acyltransferase YncA